MHSQRKRRRSWRSSAFIPWAPWVSAPCVIKSSHLSKYNKSSPHGGTRGKVCVSAESIWSILWGPWVSVPKFTAVSSNNLRYFSPEQTSELTSKQTNIHRDEHEHELMAKKWKIYRILQSLNVFFCHSCLYWSCYNSSDLSLNPLMSQTNKNTETVLILGITCETTPPFVHFVALYTLYMIIPDFYRLFGIKSWRQTSHLETSFQDQVLRCEN